MKYDFLTDEIIKKRCAENGINVNPTDSVKRKILGQDYSFDFYSKRKYLEENSQQVLNTVAIFSEKQMNLTFLKDIRREKLLRIDNFSKK